VRRNVIHDVHHPRGVEEGIPIAIYVDDEADWVTIQENVIYANQHPLGGSDPRRVHVIYNYWDDETPVWYDPIGPITVEKSIDLAPDRAREACVDDPACTVILDRAGLEPRYRPTLAP